MWNVEIIYHITSHPQLKKQNSMILHSNFMNCIMTPANKTVPPLHKVNFKMPALSFASSLQVASSALMHSWCTSIQRYTWVASNAALLTLSKRALRPLPFCDSRKPYQREIFYHPFGLWKPAQHNSPPAMCISSLLASFESFYSISLLPYSGCLPFTCYLPLWEPWLIAHLILARNEKKSRTDCDAVCSLGANSTEIISRECFWSSSKIADKVGEEDRKDATIPLIWCCARSKLAWKRAPQQARITSNFREVTCQHR